MSLPELLRQLETSGVQLRLEGANLKVSGPGEVLTSDLLKSLREHKQELILSLASRKRATVAGPEAPSVSPPEAEKGEGAEPSASVAFNVRGTMVPIEVGFVERCCPWKRFDARRLLLDAVDYIRTRGLDVPSRDELIVFLGEYCRKRVVGYNGATLDQMMSPWLNDWGTLSM